jgi:hypothetical protein
MPNVKLTDTILVDFYEGGCWRCRSNALLDEPGGARRLWRL